MDGPALTREYYRAIDEDDYEALVAVLADGFVHHRPDRTLSGRERFVRFMRDERPETDTEHVIDALYVVSDSGTDSTRLAAEGHLDRADGSEWFGFVDTFVVEDGRVRELRTYTDGA